MRKARIYGRGMDLTMVVDCTTERTVDGVRLTCVKPHGFSLIEDPILTDLVAIEDDKGRFVGKVTTIRIDRDRMTIEAVDLSEMARRSIAWPEPEL